MYQSKEKSLKAARDRLHRIVDNLVFDAEKDSKELGLTLHDARCLKRLSGKTNPNRRISAAEKEEIKEKYVSGMAIKDIAEAHHCSANWLVGLVRKSGIDQRLREYTVFEVKKIRQMYLQGFTYGEIAKQVGRNASSIRLKVLWMRKKGEINDRL